MNSSGYCQACPIESCIECLDDGNNCGQCSLSSLVFDSDLKECVEEYQSEESTFVSDGVSYSCMVGCMRC